MKHEIRTISAAHLELRASEGDSPVIAGYAAVFNALSEDLGGFREQIAPGAFANGIAGDVRALFNHDPNIVLARTKSGTLKLNEDEKGLRCEFTPPNSETSRHLIEAMRRGDVDQMSFAFRTRKDAWAETNGDIVRTLLDVEVFDVSVVTYPAYPQTEVAVRSLADWKTAQEPVAPVVNNSKYRRLLEIEAAH